jgi:hypothetical protein
VTRYVVQQTWDDAPHLSPETRAQLESAYPIHERDARVRGIPQLGSGVIFPIPETEITVKPFDIPAHFRHSYGMDVGWNRTAAAFFATDEASGTSYLYSEYYRSNAEPPIHAMGIKARGAWIPGAIDPAARGRSQRDGEDLFALYIQLGLKLVAADNSVETGLYEVWTRLSAGKIKVFDTCTNWLAEYRMYRRDEKGKIVKDNDHLMDATRYWEMTGRALAVYKPKEQWPQFRRDAVAVDAGYDPFAEMHRAPPVGGWR